MATSFSSQLKKTAKKSLVKSFLGSGVVGRAAMKTFVTGDKEDDPVKEALEEQTRVQEETNTTIVRMESVVINIADNVHNIAAVWSERVASMEEAKRAQQERISKEQAALEEAENEAARMLTPLPSATSGTDAMKQQQATESGILGKLAESLKGTRLLLRGVMGKVGLLAAGLGVAGAAVGGTALTYLADKANTQDTEQPEPAPEAAPQTIVVPGAPVPEEQADRAADFRASERSYASSVTPSSGGTEPIASSPAAPPPSFAASGSTSGAVPSTSSEPGGMSGAVASGGSSAGGLSASPAPAAGGTGSTSGGAAITPGGTGSTSGAVGSASSSPGGLSGAVGSISASAGGLSGGGGDTSTSPGGLSGAASSSSTSSPSISLPSLSTSGREISGLSTAPVTQTSQAGGPVVMQNNSGTVDDQTENSPLPSPVADRGSLDLDVYFKSRYI